MAFTAFTGAASHFVIGGKPDGLVFTLCVIFTLIWARIAAVFANKATPKTLNRVNGCDSCYSWNRSYFYFHLGIEEMPGSKNDAGIFFIKKSVHQGKQ